MSEQTQATAITYTQAILTSAWGTPVKLAPADELDNDERSATRRFQVIDGPADAPGTVIAKQVFTTDDKPFTPLNSDSFAAQRFFNEWSGLSFLKECFDDEPPAPQLYGADQTKGILVLEDLGQGNTLVEVVQGNDSKRTKAGLVELMTTLGRIHASTIGKQEQYQTIRQSISAPPIRSYFSSAAEGDLHPTQFAKLFQTMLDKLGISAIAGVNEAIEYQHSTSTRKDSPT
ncbi:MAG: hypothetical protein AAF702_04655 [Chloroflexota bacterium]